jgi:hydrogenase maturation protease
MQSEPPVEVAVVGIGNILRCDEGVGIHALRRLIDGGRMPPDVRAIDGGVMGLELAAYLHDVASLIIIDAIDAGKPAGTILRIERPDLSVPRPGKLSMHEAGVFDLLTVMRMNGGGPRRIIIWGIQPERIDWSLELSAPVAAAVPALVEGILNDLRSWSPGNA